MDKYRNSNLKERLINFIKKQGITLNTNTKARGHQGFFITGRIDISKNIPEDKVITTLIHEFAHYVHFQMESDINKTGGSLEILFKTSDVTTIFEELKNVTYFVDESASLKKLYYHKNQIKDKIKELDNEIKKEYPKFQRSKNFKELEKLVKKTDAKYLLKYDKIKIRGWFFQKPKIYSIDNIERDFPELKASVIAFIKLKSYQKKQSRVTSRINKYNKYYSGPTELFARFIEGLYFDKKRIQEIAPISCLRFYELLEQNYYKNLKELFNILDN